MLMTVFSPDGEPFEVSPRVAKNLVVYKGWTFSPPVKPAPVVEPVAEPEVPTPVFKTGRSKVVPAASPTE